MGDVGQRISSVQLHHALLKLPGSIGPKVLLHFSRLRAGLLKLPSSKEYAQRVDVFKKKINILC